MTKAQIIREVAIKTGVDKDFAGQTIETFLKVVKNAMASGNNIYIRGFGTFAVKKRAAKKARNISKGVQIVIPEHYVPTFKPADVFLDKIKNGVTKEK